MSQCTNTTTAGSSSCQSFRQGESSLPMVAECLSKFTSSKEPQHHKEKRKPHLVKLTDKHFCYPRHHNCHRNRYLGTSCDVGQQLNRQHRRRVTTKIKLCTTNYQTRKANISMALRLPQGPHIFTKIWLHSQLSDSYTSIEKMNSNISCVMKDKKTVLQ
ncbi:hypothetical protein H5410_025152 [Solanum commersonii]|uniref:Uncharacterized protein n=1 Tax=Solanum commersonii TaxID=4109 RepID=A0A9J5YX50_SOLCO|nr:hypothetical protein H5410_025152 [Solanum commersonii]